MSIIIRLYMNSGRFGGRRVSSASMQVFPDALRGWGKGIVVSRSVALRRCYEAGLPVSCRQSGFFRKLTVAGSQTPRGDFRIQDVVVATRFDRQCPLVGNF